MTPDTDGVGDAAQRPLDVDTGFWLWMAAVPLMAIGYVIDVLTGPDGQPPAIVIVMSAVFMVVIAAIVVTFLILMRQGYRWARTLLTGGGVASVVYAASSLFSVERSPTAAVSHAITAIIGSVLIGGGIYLLHRQDVHSYFTR